MDRKDVKLLFDFVDEACTNRQIQELLRKKKADGAKVRIGQSAEEISSNLREAYDRGVVTLSDLTELLAVGEENGRQHIFFYRVKQQSLSKYGDPAKLHSRLHSKLSLRDGQLPHFVLKPRERTLSDIRLQELNADVTNIIVKWYSGREYEEEIDRKTETRDGERIIIRESKVVEVRLVSLARFHPRGLLEIRVPTGTRESRKTCLAELNSIWQFINEVFDKRDFIELDLCEAMHKLYADASKPRCRHRVCGTQAADGGATAEFNPAIEGQDLFSSQRHREAMAHYETVKRLDVWWRSPFMKGEKRNGAAKTDPADEIRGQMGIYETHGIRFGSKRTGEEMDYVINRIWDYAKPKR